MFSKVMLRRAALRRLLVPALPLCLRLSAMPHDVHECSSLFTVFELNWPKDQAIRNHDVCPIYSMVSVMKKCLVLFAHSMMLHYGKTHPNTL